MKRKLVFIAFTSIIALVGCATDLDTKSTATATATIPMESSEQVEPDNVRSSPETYFGPWTDELLVVDGRWLVGDDADIPTGGFLLTPSEVFDCSWRVLDDQGTVVEEVLTTSPSGAFVRLEEADIFESSGCSVWKFTDSSGGPPAFDFNLGGESKDIGEPVGSGTYVVGEAIPSGSYEQVTRKGLLGLCKYSIKEQRRGRYFETLTFSSSNLGARSETNVVLDLEDGNLFETDGCGLWQRYRWSSP